MFDPEKPPELEISKWLNTAEPVTLAGLKDKVVVVLAFQMKCPACLSHALPQAVRLAQRFNRDQVVVLGLHSVFEDHDSMPPAALEAFLAQNPVPFPVGIDAHNGQQVPVTMATYEMQGTPTTLVFDRAGRLRRHYYGQPDDILMAAEIMAMAIEDKGSPRGEAARIERKIQGIMAAPAHEHDHDADCGCGHDHAHHDHHHGHGHDGHHHGHGDHDAAGERRRMADGMTEPVHPSDKA